MMLEERNAVALARRKALPAQNNFSIKEIQALPHYFGWVQADVEGAAFLMFLGGNDDGVAQRFFWNGAYENTTLSAWARLAAQSSFCVDIGAHTGAYTLAAKAANPRLKAIALEPHAPNFARLALNLRANGFDDVFRFQRAAGAKEGTAIFYTDASADSAGYHTSGGSLIARQNANKHQIGVMALDSSLNDDTRQRIDLVKIDTEGHEVAVLEGMQGILKARQPALFFECSDAATAPRITEILHTFGYQIYEVDEDAAAITPVAAAVVYAAPDGTYVRSRLNRIALAGRALP